MIYTVTLNPSLDYIALVDNYENGKVNRTSKETIFPGGKGINVSIVLKNLGIESIPMGFVAGFTGKEIKRLLMKRGIEGRFVDVSEGMSRINVKLKSLLTINKDEKIVAEETEINGQGPVIAKEELEKLFLQTDELKKGDILVLAGSIPDVLPSDIYKDIILRLKEREILIVVDASNDLLVNVLPCHPFLIKPNKHELGEIFGVNIHDKECAVKYAKKLQDMGARNVLVSMAAQGAVLVTEDGEVYSSEAADGKVINCVGAGDSMVAGFLYGYLMESSYERALLYGVCAGSASAFSENLATLEEVKKLMNNI